MIGNIVRFLFKLLVGLACAVLALLILLSVAIHLPDPEIKDRFAPLREDFETVNSVMLDELEDRGRTKMLFELDFENGAVKYDGETVYSGPEPKSLKSFGNYGFDGVTVLKDKTIFYYGQGVAAIVYSPEGNPGSFAERHLSFVAESFKLADDWYYTENCHLENEEL